MCKLQRFWKNGGEIRLRSTMFFGAVCFIAAGCSSDKIGRTDNPAAVVSVIKERETVRRETTADFSGTRVSEKQWAARLASRLSRSTQGLSFKRRADGITTVKLQGRFGHATLAQQKADGTVRYGCVDSAQAAQKWIGFQSVHGQAKK